MHLMIDLETLSTAGDAAIAQIGLAPFWGPMELMRQTSGCWTSGARP